MENTNIDPRVQMILNERRLNNNNISSNQLLHNIQLQNKIRDSNTLRHYLTHKGNEVIGNNMRVLEEHKMTFYPKRRPDERTISSCDKLGCSVSISDPNGYGQKRTHNI